MPGFPNQLSDQVAALAARYRPYPSCIQIGIGKFPIDDVPEGLQITRPGIAVIDVISMFPYIAGQQRYLVTGERGSGITGVDDCEGSVLVPDQPGPAGAEVIYRGISELLFEFLDR